MSLRAAAGNKKKKTGDFISEIPIKKNRKGLSEVVGYVLLIAVSLVLSVIVYIWLKSYVPSDVPTCDEGTSVFIKNTVYDCNANTLSITVENNGKFSVYGYFIHVSNDPNPDALPSIDLSSNVISGGTSMGGSISFDSLTNALTPDNQLSNEKTTSFNVSGYGQLSKVEIIPTRLQQEGNKQRFVTCGDVRVDETLACQ